MIEQYMDATILVIAIFLVAYIILYVDKPANLSFKDRGRQYAIEQLALGRNYVELYIETESPDFTDFDRGILEVLHERGYKAPDEPNW